MNDPILFLNMSEKFSLKWNDYHANVSKSFEKLRTEEYLQDVTLVGDDDFQVKAHKLVLSACSSYFHNIFTKNIQSSIMLCLQGITQKDLQSILDYMYNGEVQIFQEELDRFLTIAQRFKLEGLMGNSNESQFDQNEAKIEHYFNYQEFEPQNEVRKKHEPLKKTITRDLATFEDKVTIQMSTEDMNEITDKINQSFEKVSSGVFECKLCGKINNHRGSMKRHVETHLEGLSYPCQQCGKTFRSKHVLESHFSLKHK